MSVIKKIMLVLALFFGVVSVCIVEMPAWLLGTIFSHYSDGRFVTRNESGSFWNGSALLVAVSENHKVQEPLLRVNWNIKLGFTKFVSIDLKSYNKQIAYIYIDKNGLNLDNVDLSLAVNQLTIFIGNLNSLNLTGNLNLHADNLKIAKSKIGTVHISLSNIGSGMSPVNPIGNYGVNLNLENMSINVDSNGQSLVAINGSGNLTHLNLSAKVDEDKKTDMLQFMTMLGVPQPDGSYELKVY